MLQRTAIDRSHVWITIPGILITGLVATTITVEAGDKFTLKFLIGGLAAAILLGTAFLSGYPREVFLGAWVFALTYNRQYFLFDGVLGKYGSHGPYVILADGALALLLLLWFRDWGSNGIARPKGAAIWPWLAPFVAVCAISALLANHTDWSLFEMLRLVRIGLVLVFFRYQVSPRAWWIAIAAMGAAVLAQSLMGMAEVLTGRSGFLGVLGMGSLEDLGPVELRQESFYGWRRATGTMSHPPNLACYLMMTIPVLAALAFTAKTRKGRLAAGVAALAGLGGLMADRGDGGSTRAGLGGSDGASDDSREAGFGSRAGWRVLRRGGGTAIRGPDFGPADPRSGPLSRFSHSREQYRPANRRRASAVRRGTE